MATVRRGTVLSFDSATWLALVQLDGADVESQMPVGQWVASAMMVADAEVAVLLFDPTNTDDGVVLGPYGAVSLWNFPAISGAANGQLLIGNGAGMVLAVLIGTANRVTVTNGAGTITLSGPQDLGTGSSPTFSALNLGTASGAAAGQLRTSDALYLNQSNASFWQTDINALANNGIAQVTSSAASVALLFIINSTDGTFAIYTAQGAVHATQEISDPSAKFTNAAGGAASVNIYWSAGNARYELENKLGSTKNFRVFEMRNG
jgi:hypothetical protein